MNKTILEDQTNWHSQSLQGCLFAAYAIGKMSESAGIKRLVIEQSISVDLISETLQLLESAFSDEGNAILSLIIPSIKTKNDLLEYLSLLKKHTDWDIDDSEVYNGYRIVKIRIPLSNENDVYGWVLSFGPFEFYPQTRQSPYFEILVATKSKAFLMQKYNRHSLTMHNEDSIDRGGTNNDAHLADIHIEGITNNSKKDNNMWDNTSKRKYKILTKSGKIDFDDTLAKAKISISYPI